MTNWMKTKMGKIFKLLLIAISMASICVMTSCAKKGCMDKFALNWDDDATEDDGSCYFDADMIIGTWNVSKTFQSNTTTYSATISRVESSDNKHIKITSSEFNDDWITIDWQAKTITFNSPTYYINGSITNENDIVINKQEYGQNGPIGYAVHHFTR